MDNLKQRKTHKKENTAEKSIKKQNNKNKKSKRSYRLYIILIGILLFLFTATPYFRFRLPTTAYYLKLHKLQQFEGNLKENNLLENAIELAKGKLVGPEALLFVGDQMYSGLVNGQLVRIDNEGNLFKLVQSGDATDEECNDVTSGTKKCGLILGMRYKAPNCIYFIDAYNGLFKYNLKTNEKKLLLSSNNSQFGNLEFMNDLDLDNDGNIYFTQSSKIHSIDKAFDLIFEASPTGRVFKFNENTKKLNLLMEGIQFANGIQLTPQKDALIVSDFCMARLLKYHLKGEKQNETEVFLNLPGAADNIRLTESNTLLVPIVFARSHYITKPSIIELFGEYPTLRSLLNTFINFNYLIFNNFKYALLIEYDLNGTVIKSWHDANAKIVDYITTAVLHNNKLYLGSFYKNYISIIDY